MVDCVRAAVELRRSSWEERRHVGQVSASWMLKGRCVGDRTRAAAMEVVGFGGGGWMRPWKDPRRCGRNEFALTIWARLPPQNLRRN